MLSLPQIKNLWQDYRSLPAINSEGFRNLDHAFTLFADS